MFLSWNLQPCPAHGCPSWPPQRAGRKDPDLLGTLPAHGGLIRTGTADLIGLAVLERESPGQARMSRWGLNRSNKLYKAEVRQLRKRNALVTG